MADRVCVGAIAGAFGVRGEVRLKSFCAVPEDIAAYGALSLEDGSQSFSVKLTAPVKGGFAARLGGVANKEAADALKGQRLYAPRDALPALPDDEFYHTDLIGLEACDTGGKPLGRISAVLNHGASDLLEVRAPGKRSTTLVPFTAEIVPTVDLKSARVIIDPPEGLFED